MGFVMGKWRVIMGILRITKRRQGIANLTIVALALIGMLTACGRDAESIGPKGDVSEEPAAVLEEAEDMAKAMPDTGESKASQTVQGEDESGEPEIISEEEEPERNIGTVDNDMEEEQKFLMEVRRCDRARRVLVRTLYTYDEQGHVAVEETFNMDDENPMRWSEYTYDQQGRLFSALNYRDEGILMSRDEYAYNEQGLVTESRSYEGSTEYTSRVEYTYDDFGNKTLAKRINYDEILLCREKFEYTYDGQGNILTIHMQRMQWSSLLDRLYIYDYDSDGRIAEEWEYSLAEKDLVCTEMGFVVTDVKTDSNGILLWRYEYDYDEQGNVLEKRIYRSDGELEGYYEYVYQGAEEKASDYE